MFCVLALLAAVSCRKENTQAVEWKTELQAVKSNLVFLPGGGTGTLEVNTSSVSVTSDKSWCTASASGNVVTVSVNANTGPQSRYAKLTLTSGGESINASVIQYGEVFDGLEILDMEVPAEGDTYAYPYYTNLDVQVVADQSWVKIEFDDEEDIVRVIVDENKDFGVRYATVSYSAGSIEGSARIIQAPHVGAVSGWKVAVTDGVYIFPDQKDELTVTPPDNSLYAFKVVPVDDVHENQMEGYAMEFAESVRDDVLAKVASGVYGSFSEGVLSGSCTEEYTNLARTVWAIVVCFDADGYPTGQYAYQTVEIPDRGPVKTLVEGWDVVHDGGSYVYPAQVDQFTVTPKAGYEDTYYLVSVAEKSAVSDVEDYAFNTFAMTAREEILAKVASGELDSFEAGLSKGTTNWSFQNLSGEVVVVVVAFGTNKFYTGDYTTVEFTIPDMIRPYWAGEWTMTNTQGQTYTWTIQDKEDESGDFTMYCNGLYTGTGATLKRITWFDLVYNADGSITLKGQEHPELDTYYNSSYGNLYPNLFGFFSRDGSNYYTNMKNGPYEIFTLAFSGDGVATVSHNGVTSDGIEYSYFAARYYSSVREGYMSFTSNVSITIDGLTLTKE